MSATSRSHSTRPVAARERRDRPGEVVDAVRVVAVALEGSRVAARELAPGVEDLVDQRMTHHRRRTPAPTRGAPRREMPGCVRSVAMPVFPGGATGVIASPLVPQP